LDQAGQKAVARETLTVHPFFGVFMSNRILSNLVVSAFATALGSLSSVPASAEQFTAAQKKIQAEHAAVVKAGKVEPCFGTAVKGQNDC
jgi:uncharacterized membrane protein